MTGNQFIHNPGVYQRLQQQGWLQHSSIKWTAEISSLKAIGQNAGGETITRIETPCGWLTLESFDVSRDSENEIIDWRKTVDGVTLIIFND